MESRINTRIDPHLKAEGEAILNQIGLNTADFIRMTFHQLVLQKGLPFTAKIPNSETIAALQEDVSQNKNYSGQKAFDEMLADISADTNPPAK